MNPLLALLYDPIMARTEAAGLSGWRRALLAGASGRVLEIGAGTGANLPFYPEPLASLTLCEPSPAMRRRLAARAAGRAEVLDAPAEALPVDAASVDVVVCTLVLCSVADPARAIAELRRVLKPGGRLLFIEHVADEDRPGRLAWQRRVEPLWRRVAGGCRLTQPTARLIEAGGFEALDVQRASMRGAPAFVRPTARGVALKP